jgi:hypothetical protein
MLALGLLGAGYLVQLVSPLRTNTDATVFLDLAATASDGGGFLVQGKRTHFPIGYPIILAALDRAGLACSASFIGLNLIAMAAGMASTAFVLKRSLRLETPTVWAITLMTMLCWVFIKHVTLPLSDIPYFGLAQGCLALLTWSAGRSRGPSLAALGLALGLALAAIAVRTVGIALLPALVFSCLSATTLRRGWEIVVRLRGRGALAALGLVGAVAIASPILVRTQYFREFLERWHDRAVVSELLLYKLNDWGELVLNTSAAKVPGAFRVVVPLAGALVPIVLAWGARLRHRLEVVDVYTAGYLFILLVWPYRDARFWLPVFPIFLGYVGLVRERYAAVVAMRRAGAAYLAAFGALGVFALAYSSRISLAHDRFPERYAGGVYRDSYRAAWSPDDAATGDDNARVDPQIVRLVQRYSRPLR